MADNLVTCKVCGRQFDPTKERNLYDQSDHSYTCTFCLSGTPASGLPARKPRGKTGTVLRIVFGLLFIMTGFNSMKDGDDIWISMLVVGAILLIWQFWPNIIGLIRGKKNREAARKQAEAVRQRQEEARLRELNRKRECPHCGATTSGPVCEYCGMSLED